MNALPPESRRHLYWETALDRLELDVIRAERMLDEPETAELDSWDEPELSGPLPEDLLERAVHLRRRQLSVQEALVHRLGVLHREHAFAERVDRATRTAERPVYVDVDA